MQSDAIAKAQGAFSLLNAIGNWLPVMALILLAVGVYVAKDHRRALLGAGLGLVAGMLALGLGIALVRTLYLNALPLGVLTRDAAASFYDTLVRFLRLGLRTVLVFGLIVALAGFLTGRSITAVRTRAGLSRGIAWLRGGAEKAGFRTGPVGAWVYRYKRVLQFVALGDRSAGAGLLGSADRKGDHRAGTLRTRCAGDHRVPRTAAEPGGGGAAAGDGRAGGTRCRKVQRRRAPPVSSTSATLRLIPPMRLQSILKDHP